MAKTIQDLTNNDLLDTLAFFQKRFTDATALVATEEDEVTVKMLSRDINWYEQAILEIQGEMNSRRMVRDAT